MAGRVSVAVTAGLVTALVAGCATGPTATDRKATAFVRALASGHDDDAARQLATSDAATSKALASSWATFVRQLGPLNRVGQVRHGDRGGLTVEQVELRMAKGRGIAELSYDHRGVLTGVRLARWPRS